MSGSAVEPRAYPHPHVNNEWLARLREDILEPDLPIVDAHHHLWERASGQYLLEDLRADLKAGHNVRATVYIQCGYAFRPDGPADMKPVGETETVAGIAAEADATGLSGACKGIVGIATFAATAPVRCLKHISRQARVASRESAKARLGSSDHHSNLGARAWRLAGRPEIPCWA